VNHFHKNVQHSHFNIEAICLVPTKDKNSAIQWLVKWSFSGQLKGIGRWAFPGISEITQKQTGQIQSHIDYWDAGEHFYNKLPILGRILNWIKHRIARASQSQ
jgi:hypothetical protein